MSTGSRAPTRCRRSKSRRRSIRFSGPAALPTTSKKARAALEKAYQSKGYQTVAVTIPPQDARTGIVIFKVVEAKIGRLRVKNSRYFDLEKVKEKAPSVRRRQAAELQ